MKPDQHSSTTRSQSVAELVGHLSAALRALVPVADGAHVPWREREAYDEWDTIATCMFDVFVRAPVESAVWTASPQPLPAYDLRVDSYADRSLILAGDTGAPGLTCFHRLLPGDGSFDRAECIHVDAEGKPLDHPLTTIPLSEANLSVLLRYPDGTVERRQEILLEV